MKDCESLEQLFQMQLHEEMRLPNDRRVIRVHGGWIYESYAVGENDNFVAIGMVFVPYTSKEE